VSWFTLGEPRIPGALARDRNALHQAMLKHIAVLEKTIATLPTSSKGTAQAKAARRVRGNREPDREAEVGAAHAGPRSWRFRAGKCPVQCRRNMTYRGKNEVRTVNVSPSSFAPLPAARKSGFPEKDLNCPQRAP